MTTASTLAQLAELLALQNGLASQECLVLQSKAPRGELRFVALHPSTVEQLCDKTESQADEIAQLTDGKLQLGKQMYSEVVLREQKRKLMFDLDKVQLAPGETVEGVAREVAVAAYRALKTEVMATYDFTTREWNKHISDEFDIGQWRMVGCGDTSVHLINMRYLFEAEEIKRLYASTLANLRAELHKYVDEAPSRAQFNMRIPGSFKVNDKTHKLERQSAVMQWPEEWLDDPEEPYMLDLLLTTEGCDVERCQLKPLADARVTPAGRTCLVGGACVDAVLREAQCSDDSVVKSHMAAFRPRDFKQSDARCTLVNFTRVAPSHCPACDRVHDSDNTLYAMAYGPEDRRTKLMCYCRKTPKQLLFTVTTEDHVDSAAKGKKSKKGSEWKAPFEQYEDELRFVRRDVHDLNDVARTVFTSFDELFDHLLSSWYWSGFDGVWYRVNGEWRCVGKFACGYDATLQGKTFRVSSGSAGKVIRVEGKAFLSAMSAAAGRRQPADFTDLRPYGLGPQYGQPFNSFQRRELRQPSEHYTDNVDAFVHYVQHQLCSSESPAFAQHLVMWVAHILQRPLVKTHTMPVLIGNRGIGKGVFCDLLSKLVVTSVALHSSGIAGAVSKFNSVLKNKTLVLFGELCADRGTITAAELATLKTLITDSTAELQQKFVDMTEPSANYLNFIGCANSYKALHVEPGDRRFFLITSREPEHDRNDFDYWTETRALFASEQFVDDVHAYLMSLDLSDYACTQFPVSAVRDVAIQQSVHASWLIECMRNGRWAEGDSVDLTELAKDFFEDEPCLRETVRACKAKLLSELLENEELLGRWTLNKTNTIATFGKQPQAAHKQSWDIKSIDSLTTRELKSYIRAKGGKVGSTSKAELIRIAKSLN